MRSALAGRGASEDSLFDLPGWLAGAARPPHPAADGRPAVFIDKDGSLIDDVADRADPPPLRFRPHAIEALQGLERAGFALVVLTHQPGLASGRCTRSDFVKLQQALLQRLREDGGLELAGFHVCPHAPADSCLCRKPAPGLLRQAARQHRLDLTRSWTIGGVLDDVEAGRRAGTRTVLLDVGNETAWRLSPLRTPHHRCGDLRTALQVIACSSDAVLGAAHGERAPP